jgi:hypothetical protein
VQRLRARRYSGAVKKVPSEEPRDSGLRQILTWTLIALIASLVLTAIGVTLAIRFFDTP